MADTMSSSGILPTIKCSNCAAEIEISRMGDHICSGASEQPPSSAPPRFQGQRGPTGSPTASVSSSSGWLRPGRSHPPRIDPSAANLPFLRQDQLTPMSMSSNSRSMSPLSFRDGRSPGHRMPPRSATAPLARPVSPPSPELSNLDCAFPPFPFSTPRSATPSGTRSRQNTKTSNYADRSRPEPSPMFAPLSPRVTSGDAVLKRMNTIAPGPFDIRGKNGVSQDRIADSMDGTRERTETMSSNKSYSRPPSAASHAGRFQPPSAEVPEMPVLSSEPIPPRNGLDRDGRPLPNGPAPPRPARPDDSPDLGAFVELEKHGIDPATPIQDIPPNFPLPNSVLGAGPGPTGPLPRRPSEPSAAPRPRRPTITSGGAATDDGAGENGYVAYQPSGSVSAQTKPPPRTSSRNGERADSRLGDAPPVPNPIPTVSEDYSVGNPYHTPTESVSSNGSGYGSDAKTGSSRSSPPLSDASGNLRGKQSDPVNIDNAINDFRPPRTGSPWGDASGANSRPPPIRTGSPWSDAGSVNSRGPPPSFSRPMRPMEPPESPMDPAYQRRPFPAHPPSGHPAVPPPLRRPDAPAPQHRPNTSGKGKCRGCGELIKGKSVSSADGRLTGRYHKQCFVCQTCKEPFQTADFYVINNHPYCERHYHKLNGSLCESCDRGIEGEYLETQQKRKFHPHCLTCSTCNKSLSDDYFEMNGKVYCERDAARAAQQTAFLGPERKNPERRTTRLMMM